VSSKHNSVLYRRGNPCSCATGSRSGRSDAGPPGSRRRGGRAAACSPAARGSCSTARRPPPSPVSGRAAGSCQQLKRPTISAKKKLHYQSHQAIYNTYPVRFRSPRFCQTPLINHRFECTCYLRVYGLNLFIPGSIQSASDHNSKLLPEGAN
jgi:hypothetical protein